MDRRVERALDHLDRIGLTPLNSQQLLALAGDYRPEFMRGIDPRAKDSLGMTNTLLARSPRVLKSGTSALVVEVGDKFGAHGFRIDEDGGLKPEYGWEKGMSTRFLGAEDFFNYTAQEVKAAVGERRNPDVVAVIYPYPGQAISTGGSVDVISDENLPKGAVIPGISHKPVGQTLVDNLFSQGVLKARVPVSAFGRAAAVLLGHPNSMIGAELDTGLNIAVNWNGMIHDTNSGRFDKLPVPGYLRSYDQKSERRWQIAEEQIGGNDVSQQFESLARTLINGHFIENFGIRRPLTGRDIADLLNLDPGSS
ncbi:MAG TPA: hypothetical protein VJG66_03170, partial [Patescibacteria group bacterium]|nr:hypothetical protein [Patescibacteria group bacterium]